LLALPVGGGEILYLEPIYSQRKDQESAFPKLLRVLVSYKGRVGYAPTVDAALEQDRKSTRLNSSHVSISYAVFCLKKKMSYHKTKTVGTIDSYCSNSIIIIFTIY